ncbi:MAG: hypothetical protein CMM32_08780 [Rhodospirillaceae bacterium]|nr:hypothetical protein [Rhodospirillaceae bacterium]|tara:strand:- start:6302 stop:6907 length:606 start_codon:yes stop_codon:yes gene_type:complete
MRRRIRLPIVVATLIFYSAYLNNSNGNATPYEYVIDPDHFSIGFLVDHIGYAKVLGMFREAEGSFTFDEETLELTEVLITIRADSIFTNHKKRDAHLRGSDFLNSREFPEIVFEGAGSKIQDQKHGSVAGTLTLLGKRLPMVLDVHWNKSGTYPFGHGKYTIGVSIRGSFNRSDYDMSYAVTNGWVGDEIELIIELEANRN